MQQQFTLRECPCTERHCRSRSKVCRDTELSMWGLRSAPTYRFTKVELAGNERQGDELEGT